MILYFLQLFIAYVILILCCDYVLAKGLVWHVKRNRVKYEGDFRVSVNEPFLIFWIWEVKIERINGVYTETKKYRKRWQRKIKGDITI